VHSAAAKNLRTCLRCGQELVGQRADARYCCDSCRVMAYRARKAREMLARSGATGLSPNSRKRDVRRR
jgi:predicted RNA-binding Zn-ribbon protein involved in translation (DUF1610 family)